MARTPTAAASERDTTWEVVDGGGGGPERFSVELRSLEPVVHVQGVALSWEVRLRLADGRTFDGYGLDRASAFTAAHHLATDAGVLSASAWRTVWDALESAGVLS